jgi:hypothetical protein
MNCICRTQTPRFFNWMSLGAIVFLALCAPIFAQTTSGDLTGTVFDPTGAVVPDASVTATNQATGIMSTTATTSTGLYHLSNLRVGKYDITVTASGFIKSELKGLDVTLNEAVTANISLQVGQSTQTVEVSAEAATIDTTTVQRIWSHKRVTAPGGNCNRWRGWTRNRPFGRRPAPTQQQFHDRRNRQ